MNEEARQIVLQKIEQKKRESATLATLSIVGRGVVGTLAIFGISSPAGPVILTLSVVISYLLRQYALVKELGETLISIQIELDRMLIICKVIETISEENDIPLNTQDLNKWLKKILNYILTIIPKDALSIISSLRNSSGFSLSEITDIEVNQNKKPKLLDRIGSWFSPKDYSRSLMNDFTRVVGSFTILMSEFNVIILSKEDDIKRQWTGSNIFNLFIERNSMQIDEILEKPVSDESLEVLNTAIKEFKMYENPILNVQREEQRKVQIEVQTELQVLDILNKSFSEGNTRTSTNRLKPMTGTRKLTGGKSHKR